MQLFTQLAAAVMTTAVVVTADIIAPKVMIVSMFAPEAQAWHANFHASGLGNLSAIAIPMRGLSALFPLASCTQDGAVCHVTAGEGEINAAASMMALLLADAFDLRQAYFLLGGIAGANPARATLGSVAFARYAVQVGLQYEADPRGEEEDWDTGYVPYGSGGDPHRYPGVVYGTEVFELNAGLRRAAHALASAAELADTEDARALRARYHGAAAAAQTAPSVVECDVTTSDVYFVGDKLARGFEETTRIWTNGTGVYCMSAQEDNALLEVLVRGAVDGIVDFSRVMVMRAGSNFDRPPPGMPIRDFMAEVASTTAHQPGQAIATQNMYNAGIQVVRGIARDWDQTFAQGVVADNYVGDILGSLGSATTLTPDFGTPATRLQAQPRALARRMRPRGEEDKAEDGPASSGPTSAQRQGRQRRRTGQERRAVVAMAAMAANAKM